MELSLDLPIKDDRVEVRNFVLNELKVLKDKFKIVTPSFELKAKGTCFVFTSNVAFFERFFAAALRFYQNHKWAVTQKDHLLRQKSI